MNNYYKKQETLEEQLTIKGFEENLEQPNKEPVVVNKTKKRKLTPLEGQLSFII